MNHDRHSKQVNEPDGRPGRRHDPQSDAPTLPAGLCVKSLGRTLTEAQALSSADLLVLLSEDCCWQAATDHWRRRRPPLWHRGERRAWRSEGRVLRDKSRRLREFGTELGLMTTEQAGLRSRFGRDDD
jgi:hypothetical protein